MSYITIFEAINIKIFKLILLDIIGIILLGLVGIWAFLWHKRERKKEKPFKIKLFNLKIGILGCITSTVFFLTSIINYPILQHNIYNQYVNNNVSVIEGTATITVFTDDDDIERIDEVTLEDVQFNTDSKYLYNYSDNHELCLQNGDYVRITYVTYKNQNLIMKIEKPTSTDATVNP